MTIPVKPGDQIDASVYAKYLASTGISNPTAAVSSLVLAAITGSTGTSNYEGTINGNVGTDGSLINGVGTGAESSNEPMAFINLLFLPEDATDLEGVDISYKQISSASSNAHAILSLPETYIVPKNGHVVIYLSNESSMQTEVYFDDLSITVTESKVIQTDDYYPFGLAFNSWQRSTNKENKYLYNGFEKQDALDWDVFDYQARYYDPAIGRFLQVDPAADLMRRHSPYNYAFDNPIRFIDPDGMKPSDTTGDEDKKKEEKKKKKEEEKRRREIMKEAYKNGDAVKIYEAKQDATEMGDNSSMNRVMFERQNSLRSSLNQSSNQLGLILNVLGITDDVTGGKLKGVPSNVSDLASVIEIISEWKKGDKATSVGKAAEMALGMAYKYEMLILQTANAIGQTEYMQGQIGQISLQERNQFLNYAMKYRSAGDHEKYQYFMNRAISAEKNALKAVRNIKQKRH